MTNFENYLLAPEEVLLNLINFRAKDYNYAVQD